MSAPECDARPGQAPHPAMRVFVSSGEVSGDLGGARLVRALREQHPDTRFFGTGGERMRAAGVDVDVLTNHLGTVGITEALRHVVPLARLGWGIRRRILADRPDVAVLIANDFFNIVLAWRLKRRGVPTVAYFPPQVWIWGAVLRWVARGYDLVLTSFPEEQEAYAGIRPNLRCVFVGHHLAEALTIPSPGERRSARLRLGLPENGRVLTLMPGSRVHEVRTLAPVLAQAARLLLEKDPAVRFVMPVAEPGLRPEIERAMTRAGSLTATVLTTDSHDAMRASDLALVCSGTSTLEAALLGLPMVVVYRVSTVTHAVIRGCFRTGLLRPRPTALPNLLLGRRVVPECLQRDATPEAVSAEAWNILSDPERQARMRSDLSSARASVVSPVGFRLAGQAIRELAAANRPAARRADEALRAAACSGVGGHGTDGTGKA